VAAARTLEDIDVYYRHGPPIIVARDMDSTSPRRPIKFIQREKEDVEKATQKQEGMVQRHNHDFPEGEV